MYFRKYEKLTRNFSTYVQYYANKRVVAVMMKISDIRVIEEE